jgi:hypothetical protein
MNSWTLRQVWNVIEETQTSVLLELGDAELTQELLRQLESKGLLLNEDINTMSTYLRSKLTLIRDLAQARLTEMKA